MSDIILTIVLAVAVGCVYLSQRRNAPKSTRKMYSLLGSIACAMIAVESARREQPGMPMLFATASLIGLATLVLDYLKPSKPDA